MKETKAGDASRRGRSLFATSALHKAEDSGFHLPEAETEAEVLKERERVNAQKPGTKQFATKPAVYISPTFQVGPRLNQLAPAPREAVEQCDRGKVFAHFNKYQVTVRWYPVLEMDFLPTVLSFPAQICKVYLDDLAEFLAKLSAISTKATCLADYVREIMRQVEASLCRGRQVMDMTCDPENTEKPVLIPTSKSTMKRKLQRYHSRSSASVLFLSFPVNHALNAMPLAEK